MKRKLPEGHKVRYQHLRYRESDVLDELDRLPEHPTREDTTAVNLLLRRRLLSTYAEKRANVVSPTGGVTVAHVLDPDGGEVASAEATCSILDQYSRRIGRDISLGRALSALEREDASDLVRKLEGEL